MVEALELLRSLHGLRNYRPVEETVNRLLTATRAHAAFVLRPWGEQALANVLRVAELARTYEAAGSLSFRGFVERLREEAEGEAPEAPIVEEASEGVRIMTVHKAKGLEFPVVILADITAGIAGNPSRFVDPARGLCALRLGGWQPWDLIEHESRRDGAGSRRGRARGVRGRHAGARPARGAGGGRRSVRRRMGRRRPTAGSAPVHALSIRPPSDGGCRKRRAGMPRVRRGQRARAAGPRHAGARQRPARACTRSASDGAGYGVVWWDPRRLGLSGRSRSTGCGATT